MISTAHARRFSEHSWRACGPHECFMLAGLRPAGLLAVVDMRVLVDCGFCWFPNSCKAFGDARVTLVTCFTQTFHTQKCGVLVCRKCRSRTSLTSPQLVRSLTCREPRWLPQLLPTHAPLCPEQLCTGCFRPARGALRQSRAIGNGPRWAHESHALGRAIRVTETTQRYYIANEGTVP